VVLTTTGAVRATDDTVMLAYDDGTTTSAKVTMTINGLAVLAPDAATSSTTFKVAATPHDGDTVTLLAPTPTAVPLHVDADGNMGVASWGGADVNEGTPVVNAAGKVVALCSKSSTGPKLVAVDQRTLRNAVGNASTDTGGSTAKPSKPYLGVQLNLDPSGSLTIGAVDPNGPVAAAGIVAGDTVVAIDDDALASSEDLFDALGEHQPGDEVEVTVRHSDGSEVSVDVVLGTSPASA
jgi:membrane-associated protease RseP (regulator of RpoE activity)